MRFHRLAFHAMALLAFAHAPFPNQQSSCLVSAEEEAAKITVEDNYTAPDGAENFKFEAEVSRMLDIVVNSLYQNKDVFLRELISNASDALDKIRFLSISDPSLLEGEEKLQVQIEFDSEANTLTIRDTGIGMTRDEMVSNLGTVARSGTTRFMQALKAGNEDGKSGEVSQIGQFGVGFYSAFLVSNRVEVASRHPGSDTQYVWTSANGASEFQIFADPRGNSLVRGTEITLFLKEDAVDYADESKLETMAKHYSEFVTHPIYLRTEQTVEVEVEEEDVEEEEKKEGDDDLEVGEDEEEEDKPKETKEVTTFEYVKLNGNPAIWTRSKEDISDEEYKSFYEVIAHDEASSTDHWSHFQAEGNINFKSLLYLPSTPPQSWMTGMTHVTKTGLSLYVRKVLISDEFELLPKYLSFLRGVVDSDDLPLNVNRETLQESKIIQIIRKKVVRKALEMIRNFAKEADKEAAEGKEDGDDEDEDAPATNKYIEWYTNFSPSVKMGAIDDEPNRGKIMKLIRYKSSKSGDDGWVSLEQYVENMKDWQKEIYFVAGEDVESVKKSQFLETFEAKGVEVLFFVDPIDEYMAGNVREFDGKDFKNIASDNVKLKDEEDKDLATRREKFYKKKFTPLTKYLKNLYGSIMRVSISDRLLSTPAIVSSSSFGHSANMERIMKAQAYGHGQDDYSMRSMKVFEINPRHPFIIKLLEGVPEEDSEEAVVAPEVEEAAWTLYEMALLNGGYQLTDPEAHSKRMMKFIQSNLGVETLTLEAEPDLPEEEEEAPDSGDEDIDLSDIDLDGLDLSGMMGTEESSEQEL